MERAERRRAQSGESDVYRVTIRYRGRLHRYEVFDVEATNLPDAMSQAASRFPEELSDASDLVEVRLVPRPD